MVRMLNAAKIKTEKMSVRLVKYGNLSESYFGVEMGLS